ncbi:hypothetical protein Q3G72_030883 [Acer saccharum]|nr:hypothetical protein Q3G72_030883 [Acer saccharum]
MSSTGGTTKGGSGLQFPVESERQSIVDIKEETNNDHENTYLDINDRENTCLDIEEDSINDHDNTCLAIEEDSIKDHENT